MMIRILPVLAFLAFAAVPLVVGNAETPKGNETKTDSKNDVGAKTSAKSDAKSETKTEVKDAAKAGTQADAKSDSKSEKEEDAEESEPTRRGSGECLASEEVIQDIEIREKKIKEKEAALHEKENELTAQAAAVKEELAKLEAYKNEVEGAHAKQMAEREEKVNKLMETFESMSPKSAAAVLNGVDDELAVTTLSRLTNVKAGKILANLSPEKSARLSEIMAFGKASPGKEKTHGESTDRSPASKR